jgi:hypothetical protein
MSNFGVAPVGLNGFFIGSLRVGCVQENAHYSQSAGAPPHSRALPAKFGAIFFEGANIHDQRGGKLTDDEIKALVTYVRTLKK